MQALVELFEEKAKAFTDGLIAETGATLATPTAIYAKGRIMPILYSQENNEILFEYRARLVARGYSHTEFDIISTYQKRPDIAVVEVNWRQMTADNRQIASLWVVHYCQQIEGTWFEVLAEVDPDKSQLITDILDR